MSLKAVQSKTWLRNVPNMTKADSILKQTKAKKTPRTSRKSTSE